ncbi:sigma-70 family RNA polymerase sigma factor [Cetobacterium sp.]|uniref:sigma-70 family RNA polymerase sigma factor n=1 Tax=Cetobacterium sp. TaxID=2071632 RepID=UPI003F3C98A8
MINVEYVLKKVRPFLIENNKLKKEDFKNLFGELENTELKKILILLKKKNIEILLENKIEVGKDNINLDYKVIRNLSNEQLCVLYSEGNEKILGTIIEKNENLIWSRVKKYNKYLKHKLEDDDLFQSGAIGLINAVRKFEIDKGTNLTTYAIWWIDQKIKRDIIDYGFTIRIPVHMFDVIIKVNNIMYNNEGMSKEKLYDIARKEEITLEKFELAIWLRAYILKTTSINVLVGEDLGSELGDFIIDDSNESIAMKIEKSMLREELNKLLNRLTEREKEVLILRFGLNDGIQRTLEEIGKIFKVTRERIRQIEAKALGKLKYSSRKSGLKEFLVEV